MFARYVCFDPRVDHTRQNHLTWIAILGAILVAPSFLQFDGTPGTDDAQLAIAGIRLPGLCISYGVFGTPCPGCGLTRSFVALTHGDIHAAFAHHPLGPALYTYFACLLLFHVYGSATIGRPIAQGVVRVQQYAGAAMLARLVAVWPLQFVG